MVEYVLISLMVIDASALEVTMEPAVCLISMNVPVILVGMELHVKMKLIVLFVIALQVMEATGVKWTLMNANPIHANMAGAVEIHLPVTAVHVFLVILAEIVRATLMTAQWTLLFERPNRCKNNAKCMPSSNYQDFACSCSIGFTGRLCDEDIDECAVSSPCRNGATCININGSYTCNCAKGFEGRDCLINTDDCASCNSLPKWWYLLRWRGGIHLSFCVDGFGGAHCEKDINECAGNPCKNGATCNDYVNSYTCTCPLGFSGTNCQTNDEDCNLSSCVNGGTCIDGINNYTCHCALAILEVIASIILMSASPTHVNMVPLVLIMLDHLPAIALLDILVDSVRIL
ncbi:uncharacterized protein CEXT_260161 [Caerostris extrusa]|uniref:EGF-like domain-containing protein n=1 Tax=Caerostris extrusa TaxID=172846 RepID=A0AAV4VRG1_CAEEX|nr:uncharacterized protein CEXT_260161 [Caerostris extrusa]